MCFFARSIPVLEYVCPACGARYTTLQAAQLIDFADGEFHCENCASVLRSSRDGAADGGEGARQQRLKAAKLLQARCVLFCPKYRKSSIFQRQECYNAPAARLHVSKASTVFFPREGIVFASSVVHLSPKLISAGALRRVVALVPAVGFTGIHKEDNVCQRCIDSN